MGFFKFGMKIKIKSHLGQRIIGMTPLAAFLLFFFISTFFSSCSTLYQSGFQRTLSLQEIEAILSDIKEQEESVSSFYTLGHIMVKGWIWDSEADILIAGIRDPFQLKIEITPIEKFEVKINGVSIGEFAAESTWEGMVKLRSQKGIIIASDERNIVDKMFNGLFDHDKNACFEVVKISPSLVPTDS